MRNQCGHDRSQFTNTAPTNKITIKNCIDALKFFDLSDDLKVELDSLKNTDLSVLQKRRIKKPVN